MTTTGNVSLGLGLLSIGRAWGHVPGQPPPEAQVRNLLDTAIVAGITFFDTAPFTPTATTRTWSRRQATR